MRFHRAELQRALMEKVGDVVQLNRRLSCYTEYANHVELEFSDGSFVNCDVLIAADGIKSCVRKQFLKEIRKGMAAPTADPVWSGTLAYRGLLSHDAIEKQFPNHRAKSRAVIVSLRIPFWFPMANASCSIAESTRLAFLIVGFLWFSS
jgi:salicylate hydroxylase